ncbi:hypothetical protein [Candidatus Hodgkinia cicadicola]
MEVDVWIGMFGGIQGMGTGRSWGGLFEEMIQGWTERLLASDVGSEVGGC